MFKKKKALDVFVLFVLVFCYPVRRVIAAVAKEDGLKRKTYRVDAVMPLTTV